MTRTHPIFVMSWRRMIGCTVAPNAPPKEVSPNAKPRFFLNQCVTTDIIEQNIRPEPIYEPEASIQRGQNKL
jgi:hypothetical protein